MTGLITSTTVEGTYMLLTFFFGGLFETISWVILFLLFISLERISRHFLSTSSNRSACFLPSGLARDLAFKDPSDVPEEISARRHHTGSGFSV